ncbi:MAG: hypothetical protein LV480_10800 [Methylacidiphilales bacterium]|nr:hypothetical protein [Candidatus Methylacidiphilales bacterium]
MIRRQPITTLLVLILLAGIIAIAIDPIYKLAIRLSWISMSGSPWQNGLSGIYHLPATATVEDLLGQTFPPKEPYQIVEAKKNMIIEPLSLNVCSAALIDSDRGRRIYLFYYTDSGWHSKIFVQ